MKFTTWSCDRCGAREERHESRPEGWRTLTFELGEPSHRDLCTSCVSAAVAFLATPTVTRTPEAEELPPEPDDELTVEDVCARLPVGGCRQLYRALAKRSRSADTAVSLVELCTELGISTRTSGALLAGVRNASRGLSSPLRLIRTERRPVKGAYPQTWAWVPTCVQP